MLQKHGIVVLNGVTRVSPEVYGKCVAIIFLSVRGSVKTYLNLCKDSTSTLIDGVPMSTLRSKPPLLLYRSGVKIVNIVVAFLVVAVVTFPSDQTSFSSQQTKKKQANCHCHCP